MTVNTKLIASIGLLFFLGIIVNAGLSYYLNLLFIGFTLYLINKLYYRKKKKKILIGVKRVF